MREEREKGIARRGMLAAAGISLALHGALIASGWDGLGWLGRLLPQKIPAAAPMSEVETVLLPVEIKHFYAGRRESPAAEQAAPSASPEILTAGPGRMQKPEFPPFVTDEVTYASYIRDRIVAQLSYPPSLKKEGLEVWVRVAFSLDRRGKLLRLEIAPDTRAANDLFNKAALEAVRRAAAMFPPFPPSVEKPDQRFSFLLLFRPDMN